MKFDVNDFAYTCDTDALHKKIDSIFEQSHSNNESIAKIMNTYPTVDETNESLEQLKETMIDKENFYTSDKIILDSEGFISLDTTFNDSNDESIMTSKLLKAVNSYLNKKFVDFYDVIDDHDIWISEADEKYALKTDIPESVDLTNYATKSMIYDLQQLIEDDYISWDRLEAYCYEKADCDAKYALKSETETKLTQLDIMIVLLNN
ncbi:hypothetical protein M9Y10_021556 [Tritrichomonas musculus]|uniref:Uncharacterized protein n=1 Tax=Tritrichomonas musculus TaxID=1915356 RepID=A0ABR2KQ13_9EUKA